MDQPVPSASVADVERVVRRDFAPGQVAAVLSALGAYGLKDWHRESVRVHLAILKLAGGNVDKLRRALATADQDYRDVISYAEYPSYFKAVPGPGTGDPGREQMIEADWRQYRAWFDRR